jgi:hypothetical protein
MKKLATICSLAFLLVVGIAFNAAAIPISGAISFDGDYTVNAPLGAATEFTSFTDVEVGSGGGIGDYSALIENTPLTMYTFAFAPFSAPVPDWWTVEVGGITYSFDITSLSIPLQINNALVLEGNGIASITGMDDTPGTWTLTANASGSTFTFSGGVAVPEPLTLILLGSGLIGIIAIRRKL